MAKRGRRRAREDKAPSSEYRDADGNVLELRGSLSAATRVKLAEALSPSAGAAAATREDASARAGELLFERLAVSWTIAGLRIDKQRELLGRLRFASPDERTWVRGALREHCAEHFPDVKAP